MVTTDGAPFIFKSVWIIDVPNQVGRGLLPSNVDCKCLHFFLICVLRPSSFLSPWELHLLLPGPAQTAGSGKVITSHIRPFLASCIQAEINGPLGKFTTALIFRECYHEMLSHSGFCCFTFFLCGEGALRCVLEESQRCM